MKFPFITENFRPILLSKKIIASMLFFVVSSFSAISQIIIPDSVTVHKHWLDKDGENKLTITVNALCNPEKPPFDGHRTIIRASLENEKTYQELIFDDEDYQMEMILFRENDIWFFQSNGAKAVIIPFFYCGNTDTGVKASFIIFYNAKKYLYHINFYCNEDGKSTLNEKNLKQKLKALPKELKSDFIGKLNANFSEREKFGN